MAHDDPDCTCPPGCDCDGERFAPWDEPFSSADYLEDGTVVATSVTTLDWRIDGVEVDETGTLLTIRFTPTRPHQKEPPT